MQLQLSWIKVQEAKRMRFTKQGNDDVDDDSEDGIPSDLELLKAVKAIQKFAQLKTLRMRFSHWETLRKKFIGPQLVTKNKHL